MNLVWIGSPNHSARRDGNPRALVLHIMAGTLAGCDNWFNNPANTQASAHYGFGRQGEQHQYVAVAESAWANGIVDDIDHGPATAFLASLPPLASPNRFSISFEHEGQAGDPLDGGMFDASVERAAFLFCPAGPRCTLHDATQDGHSALGMYPCDREHVLRHSEIGDHPQCPSFDEATFTRYIAAVNLLLAAAQPDPYPIPLAYFDWRGKIDPDSDNPGPWQNVWTLKVGAIRKRPHIDLIPEGRDADGLWVVRIVVEDGIVTPEWPEN